MNVQFPDLLRPLMGKMLWRKDASPKTVYLTFDDGPVPEVTPQVLDILEKYGVKATFFCVGDNVRKYPGVYDQVLERGHKTGNHTYNHLKGFSTPDDEYVANVQKAAARIDSRLFRPPHGQIKPSQRRRLEKDYDLVMWDVITHDYHPRLSPATVLRNVTKYSRNGSIIVFHDSLKAKRNVLAVLPQAIEYLQSEGYSFGLL